MNPIPSREEALHPSFRVSAKGPFDFERVRFQHAIFQSLTTFVGFSACAISTDCTFSWQAT